VIYDHSWAWYQVLLAGGATLSHLVPIGIVPTLPAISFLVDKDSKGYDGLRGRCLWWRGCARAIGSEVTVLLGGLVPPSRPIFRVSRLGVEDLA
jgi:hypothetical protein